MKKLIFVTSKFPFCSGETFIENEIKYLASAFDKIYIFATEATDNETIRTVPNNIHVFPAKPKPITKKDYIPSLFKPLNIKEILSNCLGRHMFNKVSAVCYLSACVNSSSSHISDFLKMCDVTPEDEVTIYSYWLSTVGMCALNIKKRLEKCGKKPKCVSRCHGFDVYADRTETNYLPSQKYQIENFDEIYPCSKSGENYLKERYPSQKNKISAKYLGVKDNFNFVFPKKEEVFNIVSCSNAIPLKRVDLIAKALSKISDRKISWTHFGDGEELKNLKRLSADILPDNIKAEFKGRIQNSEIYDYYNNNNVNLFVNVSVSEGLPVSIMEAISFGIPIIATNVGGTSEIVENGINGFLLPKDFKTEELVELILRFINFSDEEYTGFCTNARKTFEAKFNAKNNYQAFCKNLCNL